MPYGTLKVDNIIFTNGGVDQTITVSGIVASTSGNLTVTGTVSGNIIRGGTTVSGATVTGSVGQFGNLTAVSGTFTTISGGTYTLTSGVFASGTAANPSISFVGDADTGIYSSAANTVAISTSGTGRLFVNSAGNVGVGTTSPSVNFEVVGTTTDPVFAGLTATNASSYSILQLRNTGTSGKNYHIGVGGSSAASLANSFYIYDATANASRLVIDSSGNVGVGTASPGTLLDVRGIISIGSSSLANAIIQKSAVPVGAYNLTITSGAGLTSESATTPTDALAGSVIKLLGGPPATDDFGGGIGYYANGHTSPNAAGIGNQHAFFTRSAVDTYTERLRIDSSGRVGIGTTSFDAGDILHVSSTGDVRLRVSTSSTSAGSNAAIRLDATTNGKYTIQTGADVSGGLRIFDNIASAERARIDSSGRLLVGTSSARDKFFNSSNNATTFQVERVGASGAIGYQVASFVTNSSDGVGAYVTLGASRGTAVNSYTALQSGDIIGQLAFQGADGTELVSGAAISAFVDGTPGADDMPGRLVFSTTADGASSPTERMRIDSAGRVGIGTASPTELLHINGNMQVGWGTSRVASVFDNSYRQGLAFDSTNRQLRVFSTTDDNGGSIGFYTRFGPGSSDTDYGTERARIDSSGRLLVGTSTALTGSSSQYSKLAVQGNSANAFGGYFSIGYGGAATGLSAGSDIGTINFTDTGAGQFAQIRCDADATTSAGDFPGRLVFSTTADGASSPTERMRIDSAGNVGVGTSILPGNKLTVGNGNSTADASIVKFNTADANVSALTLSNWTGAATSYGPKISFDNSGSGTWRVGAGDGVNTFLIDDGTTPALTIDGSRRVGIGTTSPGTYNANLAIYSAGGAFVGALHANASGTFPKASAISLGSDAVSYTYTTNGTTVALSGSAHIAALQSASSGANTDIAFMNTSGGSVSEKARIDSSGRLLVGTSSGGSVARLQVQGSTLFNDAFVDICYNGSAASGIASGTSLGLLRFTDQASNANIFAQISCAADAAASSNDYPGRLVFSTTADGASSPTERMRINNAGNVGIGTTTPASIFQVRVAANQNIAFNQLASEARITCYNDAVAAASSLGLNGSDLRFQISDTERARIDSSGRLLVGTSTARSNFFNTSWTPRSQIEGTSDTTSAQALICNSNDIYSSSIQFAKSRGATIGSNTVVQANDYLGSIGFQGSDGTEFVSGASIEAFVDGTPGANDMPTRLVFSTTADGASSPTERMRIDSAGNMLMGASYPTGILSIGPVDGKTGIFGSASTAGQPGIQGAHTANSATGYVAYFANSGSATGLYISNTAAWQSTSDLRLKTDIQDLDTTSRLLSLKPRDYLWKSQATSDNSLKRNFGFIAQEVQEVFPELVGESPDGMLSVEYTGLIAPLVKAIQEQQAIITDLQAKVAALEAA